MAPHSRVTLHQCAIAANRNVGYMIVDRIHVLCQCDRGVPIPRDKDVALLVLINPTKRGLEMNAMNMPGFTAETSLYKTSGSYQSVAARGYGSGEQRVVSQLRPPGTVDTTVCCGGRCCTLPCQWPCQLFVDCTHPDYLLCHCRCGPYSGGLMTLG